MEAFRVPFEYMAKGLWEFKSLRPQLMATFLIPEEFLECCEAEEVSRLHTYHEARSSNAER